MFPSIQHLLALVLFPQYRPHWSCRTRQGGSTLHWWEIFGTPITLYGTLSPMVQAILTNFGFVLSLYKNLLYDKHLNKRLSCIQHNNGSITLYQKCIYIYKKQQIIFYYLFDTQLLRGCLSNKKRKPFFVEFFQSQHVSSGFNCHFFHLYFMILKLFVPFLFLDFLSQFSLK